MISSFAISLEDDAKNCERYWDISTNSKRTMRVSMSSFPVKNDPANLKTETWVYFKLFKLIPEIGVRKHKQVCFRSVEADRILQSLDHVLDQRCHWYMDVYETAKRKSRVSYFMYTPKDPIKSTYIQLKLFKTNLRNEFQLRGVVSYTLQEFEKLRVVSAQLRETLKLMSSQ